MIYIPKDHTVWVTFDKYPANDPPGGLVVVAGLETGDVWKHKLTLDDLTDGLEITTPIYNFESGSVSATLKLSSSGTDWQFEMTIEAREDDEVKDSDTVEKSKSDSNQKSATISYKVVN